MCSVYLIGSEPGPKKIGIATDVYRRLKQLQTGNPIKLEIFHTVRLNTVKTAKSIETSCHTELRKYKQIGEWFDISIDIGKRIITEAVDPSIRKAISDHAKNEKIEELKEQFATNRAEGKLLSDEINALRTRLDQLHSQWTDNLKQYGTIVDELKYLGFNPYE